MSDFEHFSALFGSSVERWRGHNRFWALLANSAILRAGLARGGCTKGIGRYRNGGDRVRVESNFYLLYLKGNGTWQT